MSNLTQDRRAANNKNYMSIVGIVVFGRQLSASAFMVRGQANALKSHNCI